MNRAEHLKWCKQRAIEYVQKGNLQEAYASMLSDLGKHEDTRSAQGLCGSLGMALMVSGQLSRPDQMRDFIEGFN